MSNRWRMVGHGPMGYMWHDTIFNRYVISDVLGPGALVPSEQGGGGRRGARPQDPVQFSKTAALSVHSASQSKARK